MPTFLCRFCDSGECVPLGSCIGGRLFDENKELKVRIKQLEQALKNANIPVPPRDASYVRKLANLGQSLGKVPGRYPKGR